MSDTAEPVDELKVKMTATAKAMKAAPRGAVYVCPSITDMLAMRETAKIRGVLRTDLTLIEPNALLDPGRFRGLHLQFVLDPATQLDERHKAALAAYELRRAAQVK